MALGESAMHSIKAIFFDRDGTLIHEKPGTYLSDPAKVRLYAPVKKALQKLAKAGFSFFSFPINLASAAVTLPPRK